VFNDFIHWKSVYHIDSAGLSPCGNPSRMSQDSIPGEPTLWSRPAKEAGVRGMVSIVSQDSIPQKQPPFISDPHLSRVYDLSGMHYGQEGRVGM
jgi:hypothetical protein